MTNNMSNEKIEPSERLAKLETQFDFICKCMSNDIPHQITDLKVELKTDIENLKGDVSDLKDDVQSLRTDVANNKLNSSRWTISILITLLTILIGMIITFINN